MFLIVLWTRSTTISDGRDEDVQFDNLLADNEKECLRAKDPTLYLHILKPSLPQPAAHKTLL